MAQDFYQVLGVNRDASERDISSAYRRLARQYHPDVTGGDRQAEERFKQVNAANDVLSDPARRAAYDRWGDQWEHAEQLEEMQRQNGGGFGLGGFGNRSFGGDPNVRVEFGDMGDIGDLGDIFGSFFGGQRAGAPPRPARGRDIEHSVNVSLREAFHGTTRTLQRGAGGSRLELTIPPGVSDGQRIKFTGKGEETGVGQSGDLFLNVQVDDDPVFERRGDNLLVPVDVPVTTAALGGEVAVRSLSGSGRLALRIPAGTQNGRVFRLAGQGMPRFRGDGRGDILAEVRLRIPEPLSPEQTELFRRLQQLEGDDQ
ncbi:MAG: J domain-containing protein [Chloroflexi bacterium]|nr:J domain-containing protein [Chloroflexota bacterium]MYD16252.1 J domain-containing protein [Chloroflexota bacterium]MYJ02597.1 J domain-containing protein [Chloroflexota bacterium]